MSAIDRIFSLFAAKGSSAYLGEPVSQAEHALQTAWLASKQKAPQSLIAAALLHDVGHLLHGLPEDVASRGIDTHHEIEGQEFLESLFGPSVAEPVRLHVAAKRYLCFFEGAYLAALSPASRQSLALQGGPFTPPQAAAFERNPFYREAVLLRRWDDQAKIPGLPVPALPTYRSILERCLL